MSNLRPYQKECVDSILNGVKNKINKQVIVMATGTGKTYVFGQLPPLIKQQGKKTLILAHREELLDQARDELKAIEPNLKIEIEQAGRSVLNKNTDVVIASVQTIGRSNSTRIQKFNPDDFGLIIIDECFIAGTKVDGRSIENIKIGDYVRSFNEKTGSVEKRRVKRLFKNQTNILIEVKLSNGKKLYCTPNHPFYVSNKWINCKDLKTNDVLTSIIKNDIIINNKPKNIYEKVSKIYNPKNLWNMPERIFAKILEQYYVSDMSKCNLQAKKKRANEKKGEFSLYLLRKNNYSKRKASISTCQERTSILRRCMQKGLFKGFVIKNNEQDQPKVCFGKNEEKQSYVQSCLRRKNEKENEGKNFFKSWRKWLYDQTAIKTLESIRFKRRNFRIPNKNCSCKSSISVFTKLLFSRYRNKRNKISHRDRWKNAQIEKMEILGQKKNSSSECIRVDSIKILERGSGRRFREVCRDGYVYNFEVEENNNYFVEDILVHNCHHSTADTYKNVLRYFEVLKEEDNNSDKILLGVTATPNRSDHTGLDVIFDEITFNYSLQQGIKEDYLSNIKAFTVETKNDISEVGTRMGDFIEGELADAINNQKRNQLIVETYQEVTPDTKALVFASNVEHTVSLAETFKEAGIRVGYILGSTNKEERKELLRKFKTGEKQVIVNCNVLSEGFNEPSIETILMARPTKSSVNYSQQVGRGTRIFENKTHLNLVDFVDNLGNNNIITLPTLFGCQVTLKGTKGKFITEIVEKIESIKEVNPDYDVSNIADWNDNENIDKVIKEINIFDQATIPIEAKKYSTYSWLRNQDGFILKLPPKDEMYYSLEIKQNMLDKYEFTQKEFIKVTPSRFNRYKSWQKINETIEHTSSELEDIFKKSDNYIKDNFQEYSIILNQTGSWRADAPSDKQLSMLKKFKISVPANLSKGEASVLIGKAINERNSR